MSIRPTVIPLPARHDSFAKIRLLCCDVDGVLTDGGINYGPDGPTFLRFDIQDGMGLKRACAAGILTCFVTMSDNAPIRRRAQDLGIDHCLCGITDKVEAVSSIVSKYKLDWSEVAHIADDINDLELLQRVGMAVAVPNAVDDVMSVAGYVTHRSGGSGAVRELCDALVSSR